MNYEYHIIDDGCKLTISRNRTTVLCCNNLVLSVPKNHPGKRLDNKPGKYHEQNYSKRKKKRLQDVTSMCYNSFDSNCAAFLTLTFDPKKFSDVDLTSRTETHKLFNKYSK